MTFAHVIDGAVDQIGNPPRVVLLEDGWLDLRSLDPATLALAGWFPLVREPRPADTETTAWDSVVNFSGTEVVYGWEERPKTQAEFDADARLTSLEDRVDALEAIVLDDLPDPEPEETPVWSDPTGAHDAYAPSAIVRYPDAQGDRYRNVSGAWLVATPAQYPIGWVNLDVSQTTEWAAGVTYAVGDQVTYLGLTYQCLQAHTSQAGWTPVAVPSLWTLV